jgi:zinc finger FYVE domain-containing protein 26
VRAFGDGEGPPWQHSLFGNPSDADTVRRRTEVAEQLAERNFDLAFRLIYDFRLPGTCARAGCWARKQDGETSSFCK